MRPSLSLRDLRVTSRPIGIRPKLNTGKLCRHGIMVVHAYGRPEIMKEKDWLLRHVTELTTQQERAESKPWATSDAPSSYIEVMLRGIVGFRFPISRLEGKWKMSQNRDMQDQVGVVDGLPNRGKGDDIETAEIISRQIKSTS